MATPATGAAAIELTRTFRAPREKVFEAWTRPELMQRWLCRTAGEALVRVTEQELRAGGAYRIEIDGGEGKHYSLAGEYREVRPPERLVFTWQWVHEPDDAVSVVTVELREVSGQTELTLRHEGLAEKWREGHCSGWQACFDRLAQEMGWQVVARIS